jgi:hypothetical protein
MSLRGYVIVYFSSLGQRSFFVLKLQHILAKIMIQTMIIATVMTDAKMWRPLLSKILPMTLVAVTWKYKWEFIFDNLREGAYKSGIGEDKRPPGHLKGHMVAWPSIFPQCADANEEKPQCKAPEPETHKNAYNFNDVCNVWSAQEVFRNKQVCLATELGCSC